ncbi:MAG: hypothetical protein BWY15_02105 [Firmicutes bacterium ADurb.Bin193]|nr:MAG: hypothetical protein BWY15_02105 [Firmicutes bacterium ADurb.Bin193]
MKSYYKWLFAGLIVYAILITWTAVDKNEYAEAKEIELRQEKRRQRKTQDSLQAVINRKDDQILRSMRMAAEKDLIAQEAEKKAKRLINEAKGIKRITTHSDAQRDSLLRVVLGN